MDWTAFDKKQVELLKEQRYRDAEERLVELYNQALRDDNRDLLESSISRLASFYSLPITENRERAAFYFGERERLFSNDYSRLQTALFRFYCLNDPQAALSKLSEISLSPVTNPELDRTNLFSATALKGLCLLHLDKTADLPNILGLLFNFANDASHPVVYGDALNLVEELLGTKYLVRECRDFLELLLKRSLDADSREKTETMLRLAEHLSR